MEGCERWGGEGVRRGAEVVRGRGGVGVGELGREGGGVGGGGAACMPPPNACMHVG